MSDLQFEFDSGNAKREVDSLRSSVDGLVKTIIKLGETDAGSVKKEFAQLATSVAGVADAMASEIDKMRKQLQTLQTQMATGAKAAGKAAGKGLVDGLKEGHSEVVGLVKRQAQELQAAYEVDLAKGVKFSQRDLAELKAWGVQIGADARAAIHTGMWRTKSAARFTEDDIRSLLGMPDRGEMKTLAASLKAQMQDALRTENLRARSARPFSEDDTRALLGLPDRGEMKTLAASLKAQMQDALRTDNLRARSARPFSEDDTRALLGLPSRAEMAALTASIKDQAAETRKALRRAAAELAGEAKFAGLRGPASTAYIAAGLSARGYSNEEILSLRGMSQAALDASRNVAGLTAEKVKATQASGRFTGGQREMTDAMRAGHSAARGLASGLNAMWLTWGQLGPLLAGAALSNAFVQVIRQGSQVDNTLQTIRILSQESEQAVEGLRTQLLDLARTGPFGPLEVAEAMKTLSLAGMSVGQVGVAIKDVINLALAGNTTLQQSADVLSSVSTSFGYSAEGYNYVADVIAKTAAVSKASVESIGEAFKTASTVGKQFGVSLEDVGVGLAALANLGIQGTAAGTALRNMYTDLSGRTERTTAVLKKYNLELRDQTGRFKDIVTVAKEFNQALMKMDPISEKNFLHAVLSERGSKPFIEILDMARKKAAEVLAETGKSYADISKLSKDELKKLREETGRVLEDMRQQILDSSGFVAISAARMAMTPLNQMKAASAGLQASLVEAFEAVSPAVVAVSKTLQQVFASPEFRQSVQNLVTSVGELTRFLLDNLDAVVALGKAYLAFKALQVVGGVFSGVAAGVQTLSGSLTAMSAASTAAAARLSAAPAAATTMATAATGVATASAGAATMLARVAGIIPIVGGAVTVAAGAWMLYEMYVSKSNAASERMASSSNAETYLDTLKKETERLNENTEALIKNITVEELRAQRRAAQAKSDGEASDMQKILQAQKEVQKAQQDLDKINAQGRTFVVDLRRKAAVDALAEATKKLKKVEEDRQTNLAETAVREALLMESARRNADAVRKKAEADIAAQMALRGRDTFTDETERVRLAASNRLSIIKDALSNELSVKKAAYDHDRALLENRHRQELVSEGSYQLQVLALTSRFESERDRIREAKAKEFRDAVAAREAEIRSVLSSKPKEMEEALKNLRGEVEKFNESLQADKQKDAMEADRRRADAMDNLAGKTAKATKELDEYIRKLEEEVRADKALEDARRALAGASDEDRAAFEAGIKFDSKVAGELAKVEKAYTDLANAALDYAAAMMTVSTVTPEMLAAGQANADAAEAAQANLERLKKTLAEARATVTGNAIQDVRNDLLDKARKDITKTSENIRDKLTDAIMNAGKDGGKGLRDWLEDTLFRQPFKMVIQAVVSPISSMIANTMAGAGLMGPAAQMAAGGAAGSMFGSVGTSIMSSAMGFGTSMASGFSAGMTSLGGGLLNGASQLAMGEISSGLGMMIGDPITMGIGALLAIASSFDDSGTYHTGGGARADASGTKAILAETLGFADTVISAKTEESMRGLSAAAVNVLNLVGSTVGKAGFSVSTAFADDTSSDGSWGGLSISQNNQSLVDWAAGQTSRWAPKSFADGQEGYDEYMAAVAKDVRLALETIDLPDWAEQLVKNLGESPTMEDLAAVAQQIVEGTAVIKILGSTVKEFAQLSGEAILDLVDASGGFNALASNFNTYYENFYSDEEKRLRKLATLTDEVHRLYTDGAFTDTAKEFEALVTNPTRAAFRALVDAQDLTTESGRETYAELLKLAGLFAELTPAAQASAEALGQVSDVMKEMADLFNSAAEKLLSGEELRAYKISRIQKTLSDAGMEFSAEQIGSATRGQVLNILGIALSLGTEAGNTAAKAILSVVDPLSEVSTGFLDAAQSARTAADIMSEREAIESQILSLTENTTEIRNRELDQLDESNRRLKLYVYALEDANTAIGTLESSLSEAKSKVSELESEVRRWEGLKSRTGGLLDDIDVALGGTSVKEAALWETLRTGQLEEQIQAASDLLSLITQRTQAEAAAQNTAIESAQTLLKVGQQLRDYVKGLLTGNLSALTPSQKLGQAQADYQDTLVKAAGGDAESQAKLQGVADTYLQLSREYDPGSYSGIFSQVVSQLDAAGATFVTDAERALQVAQTQTTQLEQSNTLSAEQIAQLQALRAQVVTLDASAAAGLVGAREQLAQANAFLAHIELTLASLRNEQVALRAEAAAYMTTLPAAIVSVDPVPGILLSLPAEIAAALAPLIAPGGTPTAPVPAQAGFDAARAEVIRAYAASLPQTEEGTRMLYDAAITHGVSSAELDAAMGWDSGTSLAWATAQGLPAFSGGGNHHGGLRLVGERGWEVEATGPSRIWNQDQMREALLGGVAAGGGNVEARIQQLVEEIRTLRAEQERQHRESVDHNYRANREGADHVRKGMDHGRRSRHLADQVTIQ